MSSANFSALFQLPLVPVAEPLLDVPSVNAERVLQAEKGLIEKVATVNIVQQRVQSAFAADPDTIRLMLMSFYREKANAAYQFHFAKELPDDLRTMGVSSLVRLQKPQGRSFTILLFLQNKIDLKPQVKIMLLF